MTAPPSLSQARAGLIAGVATWTAVMLSPGHDMIAAALGSPFTLHAAAIYGLSLLTLAAFPRSRRADLWLGALSLAWLLTVARFALGLNCQPATLPADALGLVAAFAPTYVEDFRRGARMGARRIARRRSDLHAALDSRSAATR